MTRFSALAAIALTATAAQADTAGLQITEVFMPHHNKATRVAIWYPGAGAVEPELYADNPVFQGVEATMDVAPMAGKYPVVLFSHGMGGTDRAQAWLGAALAERGIISVLVNHPNTTWGDFDMTRGVAHWTRAQDMTTALDWLLAQPDLAVHVDLSRMMAAGFSYGGWTALSLGGMKGNHAGLVQACETYPEMEACAVMVSDEVNLQGIDPAKWNASYADARVTHVTAIDPGFVWGLEPLDVAGLQPETLMIGFGGAEDRMLATNFDQSGLARLMGDRAVLQIDPAYHFTAMPLCKPEGEAILAAEEDDPVCTDPAGSDRAAIHDQIVDLIATSLGQ